MDRTFLLRIHRLDSRYLCKVTHILFYHFIAHFERCSSLCLHLFVTSPLALSFIISPFLCFSLSLFPCGQVRGHLSALLPFFPRRAHLNAGCGLAERSDILKRDTEKQADRTAERVQWHVERKKSFGNKETV